LRLQRFNLSRMHLKRELKESVSCRRRMRICQRDASKKRIESYESAYSNHCFNRDASKKRIESLLAPVLYEADVVDASKKRIESFASSGSSLANIHSMHLKRELKVRFTEPFSTHFNNPDASKKRIERTICLSMTLQTIRRCI
jgi:hypothetical protein